MKPIPLDRLVPLLQPIGLFCVSQVSLVGAMLTFIRDMNLAFAAVRLELQR